MKKQFICAALAAVLLGGTATSCIGSFTLSKKLLAWNNQVGSKVVNELVFVAFCIVPVYEVSLVADLLVINSIEFWSGSNPMASGTKLIKGEDGDYLVKCDGKGYTITSKNDGTSMRLNFDESEQTWRVETPSGESYELLTYLDPEHVSMPDGQGGHTVVSLSEDGLMAYRAEISSLILQASR